MISYLQSSPPKVEFVVTRGYPQLDLGLYNGYAKYLEALKFVPIAFREIRERRLKPKTTFHILNSDSQVIGLSAGDMCYSVKSEDIDKISKLLVDLEDRRFFYHPGVDILSVIKSVIVNIISMRIVRGGSTLTQQLVRNSLLTPDRSIARKIFEIILAIKLEKHYSKTEILHLYSQLVYLGKGVRGFEAASRIIYRKTLRNLDIDSHFGIIGLLRKPSIYFPTDSIAIYLNRKLVIKKIYASRKKQLFETHVPHLGSLNPINIRNHQRPRWTNIIHAQLLTGFNNLNGNSIMPVKVCLTIEQKYQKLLDCLLKIASLNENTNYAAGVIIKNSTASIVAESSWANGKEWEFSPTFFGKLQPGSTFKTFAYLAALESGFTSDLLIESNKFVSSFINSEDGSFWEARNYGEIYRGNLTLLEAFKYSDNTAFARLAELLDLKRLESVYRRFFPYGNKNITPAIVLGGVTGGISLLDLASAYSAIARNGIYIQPKFIRHVQDTNGALDRLGDAGEIKVIESYSLANQLKYALKVSAGSLNSILVSGKSGTTRFNSIFAGYHDDVSFAIWLNKKHDVRENDIKALTAMKIVEKLGLELLGHKADVFSI